MSSRIRHQLLLQVALFLLLAPSCLAAQARKGNLVTTKWLEHNLDASKTIVLYDQGGSIMATRAFFSLHYAGFPVDHLASDSGMDSAPPPSVS